METTSKFLKELHAYIWKRKLYILKNPKPLPQKYLCIIKDKKETTVVVEESGMMQNFEEKKGPYSIITFDAMLPFELTGFLAKITKALAKKNVRVFVLSSYSTDHILVKENDLEKSKSSLQEIGIKFKTA